MLLKQIFIHKLHTGGYGGKVEFENELGAIALNLTPELTNLVIALCAEQLVAISRAAAEEMTAKVITACLPAPQP